MVSCCVIDCNSNNDLRKTRMFKLPKFTHASNELLHIQQRWKNKQFIAWVKAIRRYEIDEKAHVCSAHFFTGQPAKWSDINHPDWIPHMNMGYECDQEVFESLKNELVKNNNPSMVENTETNACNFELQSDDDVDVSMNYDVTEESENNINEEHDTSQKQKELLCELNEKGSTKKSEFPINNPEDNSKRSYDDLINQLHEKCGKFRQIQENVYSYIETCDVSTQTNKIAAQFEKLQQIIQTQADLIKELQTKLSFYEHHESVYKNDDTRSLYYTGLHFKALNLLYNALEPALPSHGNKKLTKFQCMVLTLMRMRLGLSFVDLSYRFNVSVQTISRDFHTTLSIMYTNLKQFIVWPEREILRKTMPRLFIEKLGHRKLTCIIDCFEVFVQRPAEPIDNCKVWSEYKHHQTVKFLIAITPQGSVSFISQAYVGRTSDKDITNTSGFLDKLLPGDYVAADRGFTVETEIQMMHAELIIPTFVKGRKQLLPRHLESTRKLASYRIHVERVIGLLKNKFRFFSMCVPCSTLYKETDDVCVVDQMVNVCCALINLSPPIIYDTVNE